MTLTEFIKAYNGNACISIEGYCKEEEYDYYLLPRDERGELDEEEFSGDNPNHYIPKCLEKEPWWGEVKDRKVDNFNVIGGGMYEVELYIILDR
nr:hypothetical protein [Serratia marcescens]